MKVFITICEIIIALIALLLMLFEGRGMSYGTSSTIFTVIIIVFFITITIFSNTKKNK